MRQATLLIAASLLTLPLLPLGGAMEESVPRQVIPLKGAAPGWWTPEVMARVDAAAAEGLLYNPLTGETFTPQEASAVGKVPVGAPDFLFIRPGSLYLGTDGALCTYNFIYSDRAQIGTAGHCVSGIGVGGRVYIFSLPAPTLPLVTALGTVSSFRDGGVGDDWALINIHAQWRAWVDPNMAWLGGPSCEAWNGIGGLVKHTGHGLHGGHVASVPRYSYASNSNGVSFQAIGSISGGDSGSPVIKVETDDACSMGSAAGVITHCASLTGLECLPIFYSTDVRRVPATVTVGFDPL